MTPYALSKITLIRIPYDNTLYTCSRVITLGLALLSRSLFQAVLIRLPLARTLTVDFGLHSALAVLSFWNCADLLAARHSLSFYVMYSKCYKYATN
ncbi:hypothetical protein ACTXT7_011408 [Hymenolepis weldensis]